MTTELISAAELAERLVDVRVLDVRGGEAGRSAYLSEHIEGASWVDLDRDLAAVGEDAAVGGRHPLLPIEAWCRRLGDWGIAPGTDVVVYDAAGGAFAAARAWWMLRAVGHRRVAVLDGGWQAAVEAGIPKAAASPPSRSCEGYPAPEGRTWQMPTVSADDVEELRFDSARRLIDVRSPIRYRGDEENLDPIAGHIPGAVNLPYAENLSDDGRFRDRAALRSLFEERLGRDSGEALTVYCGSGVTACHTLFALELAGFSGAGLYVGSWSEWCRSERPRATIQGSP
jgi:thiosulfate/3-mercaptopyruvate sulfurtransferase